MNEGLGFDVDKYIEELTIKEPKEKGHALKHMGVRRKVLTKHLREEEKKNRQIYSALYYFRVRGDI
jgi:hypothetical protein